MKSLYLSNHAEPSNCVMKFGGGVAVLGGGGLGGGGDFGGGVGIGVDLGDGTFETNFTIGLLGLVGAFNLEAAKLYAIAHWHHSVKIESSRDNRDTEVTNNK